jgi:hypothetical protein
MGATECNQLNKKMDETWVVREHSSRLFGNQCNSLENVEAILNSINVKHIGKGDILVETVRRWCLSNGL